MKQKIRSSNVLMAFILPALTATVAGLSDQLIQTSRALDASPTKDAIKDQSSLVSSVTNTFIIGYSSMELIITLIKTGIWSKLSWRQQATIATGITIAAAGSGYAIAAFGIEHNTLAAGISAASGVLAMNATKQTLTFFAKDIAKIENEKKIAANRERISLLTINI